MLKYMEKTQIDSLIKLKDKLADSYDSYSKNSCDLEKVKILNLLARQVITITLLQIEYDIYKKTI